MRYNNREPLIEALENLGYRYPYAGARLGHPDVFIDDCLRHMYEVKGYSLKKITSLLPVSYYVVRTHLFEMGVELRSCGGPNNLKHGRCLGKGRRKPQ